MTWSNPPDAVAALQVMLLACPSISITSNAIHYPSAAIGVDGGGGSVDALPLCVIAETSHTRTPYAEIGVTGVPSGELTVTFYRDTDAGTLEKYVRTIAKELGSVVGLPGLSASAALASDPTPGARATDEQAATGQTQASHRVAQLTISYGLR